MARGRAGRRGGSFRATATGGAQRAEGAWAESDRSGPALRQVFSGDLRGAGWASTAWPRLCEARQDAGANLIVFVGLAPCAAEERSAVRWRRGLPSRRPSRRSAPQRARAPAPAPSLGRPRKAIAFRRRRPGRGAPRRPRPSASRPLAHRTPPARPRTNLPTAIPTRQRVPPRAEHQAPAHQTPLFLAVHRQTLQRAGQARRSLARPGPSNSGSVPRINPVRGPTTTRAPTPLVP
jgi:hypothetical protein